MYGMSYISYYVLTKLEACGLRNFDNILKVICHLRDAYFLIQEMMLVEYEAYDWLGLCIS